MTAPDANDSTPTRDAGTERLWRALVKAARLARTPGEMSAGEAIGVDGRRVQPQADSGGLLVSWEPARGWVPAAGISGSAAALLDLYLPLLRVSSDRPITVGHLGQSLDGNVATASGDSYFVTGPANLLHLHRMRALSDAVIVGAGTVAADDPQLTTRRAEGADPVRVVLDPDRRLSPEHRVFRDEEAPTLLVCDAGRVSEPDERHGSANVLGVRVDQGRFDLDALLGALHERGLYALFVEGGGRTVSGFLEAELLDRLQIAIAPLITGAGRPGLSLAARDRISECLRPAHRLFAMGDDVLFDCDLADDAASPEPNARNRTLSRIL